MGKFLAALFSLVLGIALGAVGVPLAAWVAMALYRSEVALGWAVWLVERSPLPFYAPAVQVANDAIRRDSLVAAGLAAALLCLTAFSLLHFVRRALRAANESHDGKGMLELKTRPLRVGRPVEGNIWLTHGSARDSLYRVELSCKRDHGSGRSEGSETPYSEEVEVAPVRVPVGWSLPFRFVVPPIAPPSGASYVSGPGYSWRLAFRRSKSWLSSPSVFTLYLAPAAPEQLRPLEKREMPQKQPIEEIVRSVGKEPVLRELAQLREPSVGASRGGRGAPTFSVGDLTPGDAREADAIAPRPRTVMSEADLRIGIGGAWSHPDSLEMRPEPDATDRLPRSPARLDPREVTGAHRGVEERPLGDLTPGDARGSAFGDVTPGGARAPDTFAYDRSTDIPQGASRGGAGSPESGRVDPVIFGDLTSQAIVGGDPFRLTRLAPPGTVGAPAPPRQPPRLRDATPDGARADDTDAYDRSTYAPESASSLPGKIVKGLFLVVFGGVLAVSAVALATAVLLSHIM